jgi:hypothetical protein
MSWILIDDFPNDAGAYADHLARGSHPIRVEVLLPDAAKELLLTQKVKPDGILMDVDLSYAEGERNSGPGLAQHIRVKQKARDVGEYPVVRFSYRDKVEKNVQGDPTSDDLFDLKIQKEEVPKDRQSVQRRLLGISKVYAGLATENPLTAETLGALLGIKQEQIDRWSHTAFNDRLLSSLQVATHVAASAFMRGFIAQAGLLVGEEVLSFRLGVDRAASGNAWESLRDILPFRYTGLASDEFARWWARGLDDWWYGLNSEGSLAATAIGNRIDILNAKSGVNGLVPLQMPRGSAGDKPWRSCVLTLEEDPLAFIPVDPAEAVRLTPRDDLALWVDPLYAALGPALSSKDDLRLNRTDLERLRRKYT